MMLSLCSIVRCWDSVDVLSLVSVCSFGIGVLFLISWYSMCSCVGWVRFLSSVVVWVVCLVIVVLLSLMWVMVDFLF